MKILQTNVTTINKSRWPVIKMLSHLEQAPLAEQCAFCFIIDIVCMTSVAVTVIDVLLTFMHNSKLSKCKTTAYDRRFYCVFL